MRTIWLALNVSGHQITAVGQTVTDWVGMCVHTSHSPYSTMYYRLCRVNTLRWVHVDSISLGECSMVVGLGVSCSYEGTLLRRHRHSAVASSSPSRARCVSNGGKEGMVEGAGGGTLGLSQPYSPLLPANLLYPN